MSDTRRDKKEMGLAPLQTYYDKLHVPVWYARCRVTFMYVNMKWHFVWKYKSMQMLCVIIGRHGAKNEHKLCFRLGKTTTDMFQMLKSVHGDETISHTHDFDDFSSFMKIGRTFLMTWRVVVWRPPETLA